jgi:hypothetical protein
MWFGAAVILALLVLGFVGWKLGVFHKLLDMWKTK